MNDARFEDGRDAPLNLGAYDAEDLGVIAALAQDAVFPITEVSYDRAGRRFAVLLNRFRWEESAALAEPERVQSVLVFSNVLSVASSGVDRSDRDQVLSLLSIAFEETEAPAGTVEFTLAGDGAVRLTVEALEATLRDVTKPYAAPSRKAPKHPD
ncbi:DUF2948 family protein [Sulfitobacter sp. D35]|uniref:DUF2948 family protein n=1 Tax=Sulfitobacter sp. D35 TaxID=3083252 RepID=UPI00296F679E|nr:DUF2948 family protein [Sulfitobacter sp. D35]MDW4499727.1 DUF2948 family protein [Sulfitobacter sp. D35]